MHDPPPFDWMELLEPPALPSPEDNLFSSQEDWWDNACPSILLGHLGATPALDNLNKIELHDARLEGMRIDYIEKTRPAKKRIEVSVGESVRIIRELQALKVKII